MNGKLKHSLKERCPECGSILQMRVVEINAIEKGTPYTFSEEFIGCSNKNCEYEREVEQKRRRRQQNELE